ncbi:MAG: hypothetical protein WCG85_05155 [Polyangia bacterium]
MAPNNQDDSDPKYTVVIIGDDGCFYKLTKEDWKKYPAKGLDGQSQGVVNQLKEFGSYLAYIPTEIAVGIGWWCTVVNLQSIVRNQQEKSKAKEK